MNLRLRQIRNRPVERDDAIDATHRFAAFSSPCPANIMRIENHAHRKSLRRTIGLHRHFLQSQIS
jgi:hypothetical protein